MKKTKKKNNKNKEENWIHMGEPPIAQFTPELTDLFQKRFKKDVKIASFEDIYGCNRQPKKTKKESEFKKTNSRK